MFVKVKLCDTETTTSAQGQPGRDSKAQEKLKWPNTHTYTHKKKEANMFVC